MSPPTVALVALMWVYIGSGGEIQHKRSETIQDQHVLTRAALPPVDRASVGIRIRVTVDQYDALQRMARDDCSSVSHIVRRLVAQEIRRAHAGAASSSAA